MDKPQWVLQGIYNMDPILNEIKKRVGKIPEDARRVALNLITKNPPLVSPISPAQQRGETPIGYNLGENNLGRNPDLSNKLLTSQVQKAIQDAAMEFKVPSSLLFDIAYSEGGFRPDARNETPEGQAVGVPVGLFQFTPGTWNNDLRNYGTMSNTSLRNWNNPQREDYSS